MMDLLNMYNIVFLFNNSELGKGAFSTVKYARTILPEKSRSMWPEYAVKVNHALIFPILLFCCILICFVCLFVCLFLNLSIELWIMYIN